MLFSTSNIATLLSTLRVSFVSEVPVQGIITSFVKRMIAGTAVTASTFQDVKPPFKLIICIAKAMLRLH